MEEAKSHTHNARAPYFRFVQGINLCGPTMLEIASYGRGALYNQEELAAYIGAYVSIDHVNSYSPILRARALEKVDKIDPRTGEVVKGADGNPIKVDHKDVGFSIDRWEEEEVKEKIRYLGLEVSVYHPSELGLTRLVKKPSEFTEEELKIASEFIGANLDKRNDVGMNFRWDRLRGTEDGHYVLVSSFNDKNYRVTVTDPSSTNPPNWSKDLGEFLYGMQPVFREDDNQERERGFIIFSGPDRLETKNLSKLIKSSARAPPYRPVAYQITPKTIDPSKFPKPIMPNERFNRN